jgi:hypothetical protein
MAKNLKVEFSIALLEASIVKVATKRRIRSEAEILDHGTNNLLRALKQDMQKKDGRVDYGKLRKDGYSDRLLAKLEQA